jgi:hypothetical protein
MPNDLYKPASHRRKQDGSGDSICLTCLATISMTVLNVGGGVEQEPQVHVCAFSFDPTRVKP